MIAALLSIVLLSGLSSTLASTPALANEPAYSPKFSFRVGNGMIKNAGTTGGTLSTVGAINLLFNYFLAGDFAMGVGYSTNPPFSGVTVSSRYYFYGQGTRSRQLAQPFVFSERRDLWAHYIGAEFCDTAYIMTSKKSTGTETLPGTSSSVNMTLGTDFRISRHFELTAEANLAAVNFSSTNEYVKLKSYILNTGLSYVW